MNKPWMLLAHSCTLAHKHPAEGDRDRFRYWSLTSKTLPQWNFELPFLGIIVGDATSMAGMCHEGQAARPVGGSRP